MNTENICTCGRYIGLTEEERIHNSLDSIFGKSEFVPMTQEEKLEIQARRETERKARIQMEINYLTEHNQPIPDRDEEITKAYNDHKYKSITQEERENNLKIYSTNYNVLRIIFGLPPLSYRN